MDGGAWWAAVHGVTKSWTRLSDFTFTFHFHALEKEMATHSSVLAWRIPGTGEPGGLPSLGLHRIGHDWSDLPAAAAASIIELGRASVPRKPHFSSGKGLFWEYFTYLWIYSGSFISGLALWGGETIEWKEHQLLFRRPFSLIPAGPIGAAASSSIK